MGPSSANSDQVCTPIVDSQCTLRIRPPRDILFIIDTSSSAPNFNQILNVYLVQAYCSFGLGAGSRVGIVTFGSNAQASVPLAEMSPNQFVLAISALANVFNTEVTRPCAEAFFLSYAELTRNDTNSEKIVLFLSGGAPNPVPLVVGSATDLTVTRIPPFNYPYAAEYFAYGLCLKTLPTGVCSVESISSYLSSTVPSALAQLRTLSNAHFTAVLVSPENPASNDNGLGYWTGKSEFVSGASCTSGLCIYIYIFYPFPPAPTKTPTNAQARQ